MVSFSGLEKLALGGLAVMNLGALVAAPAVGYYYDAGFAASFCCGIPGAVDLFASMYFLPKLYYKK